MMTGVTEVQEELLFARVWWCNRKGVLLRLQIEFSFCSGLSLKAAPGIPAVSGYLVIWSGELEVA